MWLALLFSGLAILFGVLVFYYQRSRVELILEGGIVMRVHLLVPFSLLSCGLSVYVLGGPNIIISSVLRGITKQEPLPLLFL